MGQKSLKVKIYLKFNFYPNEESNFFHNFLVERYQVRPNVKPRTGKSL